MTGIELIRAVRREASLAQLPIIIVSYKDREEDRLAGLEAGASAYLTKSSFQDDSLIRMVADLIGAPT
jgi:two-component system sensor histidine kinase and response regulator WspE